MCFDLWVWLVWGRLCLLSEDLGNGEEGEQQGKEDKHVRDKSILSLILCLQGQDEQEGGDGEKGEQQGEEDNI